MHYLLGAVVVVVVGSWKLLKIARNATNAWGDYLVHGKRPWDDEDNKNK